MIHGHQSDKPTDPAEAWRPWEPSSSNPWGRKWAAHLYRRAAFGASRADLLEAERLGPAKTIALLMQGRPGSERMVRTLLDVGEIAAARDSSGEQLRGWWLYCILQGGHPLREKMTLFWHNHFATSILKVQNAVSMFHQNCLLRSHALGKFGPFLQDVSRDAAMLVWLDSNSNVKGRPNENYAREVMELFSLGVGNYREKDIREAARAFTGWHTDGQRFRFQPRLHDEDEKTVLGQTGRWDGGDVVRIVLEQPAAARFLIRKLYAFLISENAEPSDALLEPLCVAFRRSDYDIAALVRTMISSRHFFSEHAFRQRIKSPMEFVLGAVLATYRRYDETDPDYRPLPQQTLTQRIDTMGQQLFAPPNVKGWRGGRAWLNTSTVLERYNFAEALVTGSLWTAFPRGTMLASVVAPSSLSDELADPTPHKSESPSIPPRAFDPLRLLQEESAHRPEEVIRSLLDLYVPGGIRPTAQAKLTAFLAEGNPSAQKLDQRVREVLQAILTMPEYQLS